MENEKENGVIYYVKYTMCEEFKTEKELKDRIKKLKKDSKRRESGINNISETHYGIKSGMDIPFNRKR